MATDFRFILSLHCPVKMYHRQTYWLHYFWISSLLFLLDIYFTPVILADWLQTQFQLTRAKSYPSNGFCLSVVETKYTENK